jgi:hypothetical protein
VKICLQGSSDGTNFFIISNCATNTSGGALQASGYYPKVRAYIETLSFTIPPTLSAWYSGTSVTVGPDAGIFRSSGTETVQLGNNATGATAVDYSAVTPLNSTSGTLVFASALGFTGLTAASGLTISVYASPQITGSCAITSGTKIASFTITDVPAGDYQIFRVPKVAAPEVCVRYAFAAPPATGKYDLSYIFGTANSPKSVAHTFPVMAGPGVTAGIAVDYAGVLAHTINLKPTPTPATCTFALEGSLDSTNGVDGTWTAISTAVDCTVAANLLFHVVNKPVAWIRGNLSVFTGDATARIQPYYLGVE